QVLIVAVTARMANRFYRVDYDFSRLARVALSVGFLYTASLFLPAGAIWISITAKILLVISYPFILYGLRFYHPEELVALRNFMGRWWERRGRSGSGK
ncbi:MAG: hypothetical protein JXB45_11310, partial [Candidatus Krumholzibacteriota bacterium]|nr:hypothetical protein [Candidatus Krumholzibacteriota bacterium]